MKLKEILLSEGATKHEEATFKASNGESVKIILNSLSTGGKNNYHHQGYEIILRNSKSFPAKDGASPKGTMVHIGSMRVNDAEEALQNIVKKLATIDLDLPERKNFDKEATKVIQDEVKKDNDQIINAAKAVKNWTDKDWQELWDNPTPQKVFEWEHGKGLSTWSSSSSQIKLKEISIEDGMVVYDRYPFIWTADRARLPFKFKKVSRFEVYGEKLTSTEGFPEICQQFKIRNGGFTKLDRIPEPDVEDKFNMYLVELDECKVSTLDLSNQGNDRLYLTIKKCPISSIDGMPKRMRSLNFYDTKITDLHDIHKKIKHLEELSCYDVTKNILGVFLIDGMKRFSTLKNTEAYRIIAKYIDQGGAGMAKAQRELLDADLDDFADL